MTKRVISILLVMVMLSGMLPVFAQAEEPEAAVEATCTEDGSITWTSGVLGYSIGAYCGILATKGGTMADLAMATAVYGYHAKAYFG
jgi:hypothetical protein